MPRWRHRASRARPSASAARDDSHRFTEFPADGFELWCDFGKFDPPEELHLVLRRFPKRLEAFWNGAIFVTDDLPEG